MSSNANKDNLEGNSTKDTVPSSPSPEISTVTNNNNNNNTSLSSSNSMLLSPTSSVSASSASNQKSISNNDISPSSSPRNNMHDSNEKLVNNTNATSTNNKKISSFNINDLLSSSDKTSQLHLNTSSDNSQDDSNNKHSPFNQANKKQKLNSSESKTTSQTSGSRSSTPNTKKQTQPTPNNFQETFLNQQSLNPYSFLNGGLPPMDLFTAEKLLQQFHHQHQQHQFNAPNPFLANPAASIEQFLLQQHSLNALLGGSQQLAAQQPPLPTPPQSFLANEFLLAKSLHDNSRKLNESNGMYRYFLNIMLNQLCFIFKISFLKKIRF